MRWLAFVPLTASTFPKTALSLFQFDDHAASAALTGNDFSRRTFLATAPSLVIGASNNNGNGNSNEGNKNLSTTDTQYPGTAVGRMNAVRARVRELSGTDEFDRKWEDVRRSILRAGGLRDLPEATPGRGYTGHSFNDFNHVDLTTMRDDSSDDENDGGVRGIAVGNRLGEGIRAASLPEPGSGGSWSTCAIGCNEDPPRDVAHVQFRSRIAFKLVWVPNDDYDTFVLVDDDGKLLARGTPSDGSNGALPSLKQRMLNFKICEGSKYAVEAQKIARNG